LRGSYRFRPHERLRSSSEYQQVKWAGKRARSRHFIINFTSNDLPHHRLGMVVQKRYYNAVQRNRIKRRLREWFRLHKREVPMPGKDIVIIARAGAQQLSCNEVSRELTEVFSTRGGRSS
jgi:ribonuclease P protein component